jgi:hypothetical protein
VWPIVLIENNSTNTAAVASTTPAPNGQHPDKPIISNRAFLRAVGIALVVLVLSALVLAGLILALYPHTRSSDTADKTICSGSFSAVSGTIKRSSRGLVLSELPPNGQAIISCPQSVNAQNYSFLQYTITGRSPGQGIAMLWRTRENPATTSGAELFWNEEKSSTIDLSKNETWQGHISEFALDVFGDLRGQPLTFVELELKPYSAGAVLSTIWSDWVTFRGWTQKSINHLPGVQAGSFMSPTIAMAGWVALAVVLWAVIYLITRSHNPIGYATTLLIPWLVLDMLWQWELSTQLDETQYLFAGKTQKEKHRTDREGELYSYATYLKENVLPKPGARIVLLHDSEPAHYQRLKAQFYLFPHNTFNFLRVPPTGGALEADYIWALGEIKGLDFSLETNTLRWQGHQLAVKRVDVHPLGTLYRVVGSTQ